jgi:phosphatidate cytidylyltransferase
MLKRAITGSLFAATLLFCTIYSTYALFALYLFFVIVGSWEYLNILHKNSDYKPSLILGILNSILVFLAFTIDPIFSGSTILLIALSILVTFSIPLFELFKNKPNPFSNIVHTLLPAIYVAIPFGLLILSNSLFAVKGNLNILIVIFYFSLWGNDTGAYFTGTAIGKTKLFERISPNKTWEGSFGGAFFAIAVAIAGGYYFAEETPIWQWAGIGLIISVFGSMGDLVESLFKRSMNVKDSGNILPGHGGILDRFDGLLIASPFVFAFLLIVQQLIS